MHKRFVNDHKLKIKNEHCKHIAIQYIILGEVIVDRLRELAKIFVLIFF